VKVPALKGNPQGYVPEFLTESVEPSKRISSHHKGASAERPFVTVDLENYSDLDGTAIPMLYGFSAEDGELIIKGPDVTAAEMCDLTIEAGRRWPNAIFVGYAFTSYDANFFLRDMPLDIADSIKRGNPRYYRGFRFHWLRGKYFRVSKGKRRNDTRAGNITVTIYETVSWVNGKKLVDAIREHLGEVPDLIQTGKLARGSFEYSDLESLVLPYWRIEQQYFRKLMERMRELIVRADLALPRNWWGPSCLTASAFNREGVTAHLNRDLPVEYMRACQRGYFGGRFEQPQGGFHDAPVYQYDIVSAYPSAQVDVWSWRDSHLIYIPGEKLDRTRPLPRRWRFSLWDISFKFSGRGHAREYAPMPFPMRDPRGAVYFPSQVHGTYWSPEVAPFWRSPMVTIHGGWVILPGNERPFAWMREYFERRLELKRSGDPAQYPIKICLNSAYGKTAQRAGAKQDRDGHWKLPAFHQLDWAGYITSTCRARMMQVMGQVGWENVISIETDGIFLTCPAPKLPVNKEVLGMWEETRHDGMITLQNGVYWTRQGDEWASGKVRGIRRGSPGVAASDALDFLERYSADRDTARLSGTVRMFHGAGHALGTSKFLTWSDDRKELRFGGNGKRIHLWREGQSLHRELSRLSNGDMILAAKEGTDWISRPHALPWEEYGGRTTTFREYLEDEIAMGQVVLP